MIGSRTPYRISFVGGGTDMAVYYDEEPGMVVSTSIAKYVYIFVHPYLDPATTLVKYSQTEMVQDVHDIRHPLVRQALLRVGLSGLDINSIADIPGAKVVHIKDFLAVVAEKEWNAVRAAKALKVSWSPSKPNFPTHDALYDHMRNATAMARSPERAAGGHRI